MGEVKTGQTIYSESVAHRRTKPMLYRSSNPHFSNAHTALSRSGQQKTGSERQDSTEVRTPQPLGQLPSDPRLPIQNHRENHCLNHCWIEDKHREEGSRCLVACWQARQGDSSNIAPSSPELSSSEPACAARYSNPTSHLDAETRHLAVPSHRCHSC